MNDALDLGSAYLQVIIITEQSIFRRPSYLCLPSRYRLSLSTDVYETTTATPRNFHGYFWNEHDRATAHHGHAMPIATRGRMSGPAVPRSHSLNLKITYTLIINASMLDYDSDEKARSPSITGQDNVITRQVATKHPHTYKTRVRSIVFACILHWYACEFLSERPLH